MSINPAFDPRSCTDLRQYECARVYRCFFFTTVVAPNKKETPSRDTVRGFQSLILADTNKVFDACHGNGTNINKRF